MAVSSKTIREPLLRLRSCLAGGGLEQRYTGDAPPLTGPQWIIRKSHDSNGNWSP